MSIIERYWKWLAEEGQERFVIVSGRYRGYIGVPFKYTGVFEHKNSWYAIRSRFGTGYVDLRDPSYRWTADSYWFTRDCFEPLEYFERRYEIKMYIHYGWVRNICRKVAGVTDD